MISPPTDSLYKFMAVSGLLLIVSMVIWYFSEVGRIDREQYEVQVLYDQSIVRRNRELSDVETAKSSMKDQEDGLQILRRQTRQVLAEPPDETAFRSIVNKYDKMFQIMARDIEISRAAEARSWDNAENQALITARDRRLKSLSKKTSELTIWAIVLGIAGAILSLSGFWLWYKRVQVYVDKSLRLDSRSET